MKILTASAFLCMTIVFHLESRAAEVVVSVNEPLSGLPAFSVTPGHSVSFLPLGGINTTVPQIGFPQPNTDVQADDLWGVASNYGGTGVCVMTSRHAFENSPEIAMTVGNLSNGDYDVFVQTFVNAGSDFYGGRYGFASGVLTTFFSSDGGDIVVTGDNGPGGQGQFQIREFSLGTQNVSSGDLTFYIDDFDQQSLVGNFASLRLVRVPEPSALTLSGFGLVALVAFNRRRKRA